MNLATDAPLSITAGAEMARKKTKPKKPRPAKVTARKVEPADWQEKHSPTVQFEVRGDVRVGANGKPERTVIGLARRRAAHARLMGMLDTLQTKAMEEIQRAAEAIVGGVRMKPQTYERHSKTTGSVTESEGFADMQAAYFDWARECQRLGISHAGISDVVVDGKTLTETDAGRRKREGWAKTHLIAGLDLWCVERGWRRHHTPVLQAFVEQRGKARTVYEATIVSDATCIGALSDPSSADAA